MSKSSTKFPRSGFPADLHIEGFRSILKASVPLAPLTVLVGANGSGKSNVIRSLFHCARLCNIVLNGNENRRPEDDAEGCPSDPTWRSLSWVSSSGRRGARPSGSD